MGKGPPFVVREGYDAVREIECVGRRFRCFSTLCTVWEAGIVVWLNRKLLGLSFGKGIRIFFPKLISPRVSLPFSRTECFAVQLVERYRAGDN